MRTVRAVAVAVAVAAAVCVAALSACQHSPASVPAGVLLPLPGGMPRYYVVVAGLEITVRALSVAGSGNHVLVQAFAFGRIDNGVFASLPGTTPRVLPVSAAW